MTRQEAARWLAFALLLLVVVVVYANGLHGEFAYDDKVEVIGNRTIRVLERWRLILSYNESRPITLFSYALNFRYAEYEPFTYHLVDLALHAVNAGLALLLGTSIAQLREHPRPLWTGLAAALLWAVHPMNTEAVSYVTGRSEQLTATWVFLALWLWTHWSSEGDWRSLAGAWLAAALGAFTKEVALVLPVAFLLVDLLLTRRPVRWIGHLPGVAGLCAVFWYRYETYGFLITEGPAQRELGVQLWTEAEVVLRYLQLSVLPIGQSVFHDHPETGATLRSVSAGVFLIGATALALWRRHPIYSTAWLLFLLVLAPSSSFVALKETMAEHRVHISLWAVCLAFSWGLSSLPLRRFQGTVLVLAVVLGALTVRRNQVWATEVSLWDDATQKNPNSAEAWYGYGDALFLAGDAGDPRRADRQLEESAKAYRRATELAPKNTNAWNNLGRAEATMGHHEEAEEAWKEALKVSPSYCRAHSNLGQLKTREENYLEAEKWFNTALAYCPRNCRAHAMLGWLYGWELDEKENAQAHFEVYLEHCESDAQIEDVRQWVMELTW